MKSLIIIFGCIVHLLPHPYLKKGAKSASALSTKAPAVKLTKQFVRNFIFMDDKGNQHSLLDSTKKVNMVVFWASWCSPCRMEIPNLKDIDKVIDQSSFRLISISVDKDKDEWLKAVKEEQMPWPQLLAEGDNLKGIKEDFGFTGIPQIYFIDNKGKILASYTGYHYDNGAGLAALAKQYGGK